MSLFSSKIGFVVSVLFLSPLAFSQGAIEYGKVIPTHDKDSNTLSYECIGESSGRLAAVTLATESQMLTIELDDADFRGVATRARYRENGESFVAYNLENEGLPYFYDFALTENLTTGSLKLTLRHGAFAFICQN